CGERQREGGMQQCIRNIDRTWLKCLLLGRNNYWRLQTESFFISKFQMKQSRICRFVFLRRKHEGSMDAFSGCSGGADVGNSALCASFLRSDLLRRQATDS